MFDHDVLYAMALAYLAPPRPSFNRTGPDRRSPAIADSEAEALVEFWRSAGRAAWFAKNSDFDRRFRARFLAAHEAAARRELLPWLATPTGALALILLLDQFPRNAFRGTARMYATDALAREVADAAMQAAHDRLVSSELRVFMYLPFGHSENLRDQERAVKLAVALDPRDRAHAQRHCDIVRRFGHFPHRNPILGRTTTAEEQAYLDSGGYAG